MVAFEVIDGEAIMLLNTGGDGQNIRIEDDIVRIESHPFGEEVIGALTDRYLALNGFRLSLLIKGHDHHAGAVTFDVAGFIHEVLLAFFKTDGVDDALALYTLQPGLDHRPLGAIDHDR